MDYDDWSKALSKYWLGVSSDGEAVLALEPLILVDVAKQIGVEFECSDDAVSSFIAAVRKCQMLGRPWRVETATGKRAPRFLILIAIQVFAASQMDDAAGEYTSRAYYVQLGKLVGDRAMGANFAADHGEEHRALWQHLSRSLLGSGLVLGVRGGLLTRGHIAGRSAGTGYRIVASVASHDLRRVHPRYALVE